MVCPMSPGLAVALHRLQIVWPEADRRELTVTEF